MDIIPLAQDCLTGLVLGQWITFWGRHPFCARFSAHYLLVQLYSPAWIHGCGVISCIRCCWPAWILFFFHCWDANGKHVVRGEKSSIGCWVATAVGLSRANSILCRIVKAAKVVWLGPNYFVLEAPHPSFKPHSHSQMKCCECALIANVNGYSSIRSVIHHSRTLEIKVKFGQLFCEYCYSQFIRTINSFMWTFIRRSQKCHQYDLSIPVMEGIVFVYIFRVISFAGHLNEYSQFACLQQLIRCFLFANVNESLESGYHIFPEQLKCRTLKKGVPGIIVSHSSIVLMHQGSPQTPCVIGIILPGLDRNPSAHGPFLTTPQGSALTNRSTLLLYF